MCFRDIGLQYIFSYIEVQQLRILLKMNFQLETSNYVKCYYASQLSIPSRTMALIVDDRMNKRFGWQSNFLMEAEICLRYFSIEEVQCLGSFNGFSRKSKIDWKLEGIEIGLNICSKFLSFESGRHPNVTNRNTKIPNYWQKMSLVIPKESIFFQQWRFWNVTSSVFYPSHVVRVLQYVWIVMKSMFFCNCIM